MEQSYNKFELLSKKHKIKPLQFVSFEYGVQKRFQSILKSRRSSRQNLFDSIRNLSPAARPEVQQQIEHRTQQLEKWKNEKEKKKEQLEKWKKEREEKKKEAASQMKKPFLTGVPRTPLYFVPPPPVPTKHSPSVRVTRSASARNKKEVKEKPVPSQSFAPENASFKAPQLKHMPNVPFVSLVVPLVTVSEECLSPKSLLDMPMTSEQIAEEVKIIRPSVTMSRGKDNALRLIKKKLDEGLLDEDSGDIDNVDHFRRQLASEITRMTELCAMWERISEQTALPDSIQECVLSAVGQCRLLMSKKLQQFAALVERCARPAPGQALVTLADLHGFWDMVFMQVETVDMSFKKLEEMCAPGWAEEAPAALAKKKPVRVARAKPSGGSSRLKEMIAAARKAKKDPVEKSFEAGFFCVKSPIRSPAPAEPATPLGKPSLLKGVLSSLAKKTVIKHSAPFALLRASMLGKNMEYDGVTSLPQTPLPNYTNATPGRSILKQASTNNISKKSLKRPLFDQPDADLSTTLDAKPMPREIEGNVDSGISSMGVQKEGKEKSERMCRRRDLVRQDAICDKEDAQAVHQA